MTNNLAECVRCGWTGERAGRFPTPDENGVPWFDCPEGCEAPEWAPASSLPCHPGERARSVFDPTKLDEGDALYEAPAPEPKPQQQRAQRTRVVASADWRQYR